MDHEYFMTNQLESLYWQVLVVRCQVGDHAAFEELVNQCQPRLRGFLCKLVGGQQAIDDLLQDIWIDVFRDLPKLANPGAFLPWLYRVARNRAYRLFRRHAQTIESLDMHDLSDAEKQNPADEFTAEDAQAVHAALDDLSAEHREVLLLRFMEDMSYDDIAAVIDCQVGTVKSRLYHAKQALRNILEKSHEPE
jgi:RNA polymerase sigma-70 factor, ECF subfamily